MMVPWEVFLKSVRRSDINGIGLPSVESKPFPKTSEFVLRFIDFETRSRDEQNSLTI